MSAPSWRQRGLSIVESLVGSMLSLILIAGMTGIYLSVKRTYNVQDSLARMQENARLALRLIAHDVRMAGSRGDVAQVWSIGESDVLPLGAIGGECHAGWVRTLLRQTDSVAAPALTGSNNTRGAYTGCIAAADYMAGTDILSVHFADANPVADSDIAKGKVYLRGTLPGGLLFRATADRALPSDFTLSGPARNFRLIASSYYLRPWSAAAPSRANPAGDDIPTLVRATLSDCGATTCVKSESLIEGIANLQLQFGIDHADGSGAVDYLNADEIGDFTQTSGKAAWQRVRAVRIGLLVRSLNTEPDYSDPNAPYQLGDQTVNVAGGYRYLWLTSTVALRNGAM